LEIRKQLDNSIKSEFDLKKKNEKDEEEAVDIAKLSMLLENMDKEYKSDENENENEKELEEII